ncbi:MULTISPECIES: lantibiotic dehydratase [Streptomyces]|uniref:lantibiotic dehydratase n=1 Tax=Streptomyces TaxID=1883 RepID=UPI00240DE690|nr:MULTISPECIES: lantibiotic dehydratase [Streptomyces]WFB82600.1 lantibiotic dehydratase [Streptomyces olivaceus]WGK44115.1 lantibiotic dehydratase [Streptomyces sp. B146]
MTRPTFRRHGDVLVLRAAAVPVRARPDDWPDVESLDGCRAWLARVWCDDSFVVPLRAASPRLAGFVERILDGDAVPLKRVRSATLSVAAYLLRASSRATPFGLFAGVALADVGPASARLGTGHRAVARPDTLWVDHVRRALQRRTDVLPHLTLRVSTLSFRRGDTVCTPRPGGRLASAPVTRPLAVLLEAAAAPASGRRLLEALSEQAGGTSEQAVRLLGQALEDGYLTSDLAADMTVEDPARHIVRTLRPYVDTLEPDTVRIIDRLEETGQALALHNRAGLLGAAPGLRDLADKGMRELQPADCQSRISLDLCLDAQVSVPHQVLDEVERAAHTLVRLTRAQGESPAWAAYQTYFWERYGAGVLVPVRDAADLAAGLGFPAGYPMSVWSEAPPRVLPRDEQLAARAMRAAVTGDREIVLTERDVDALAGGGPERPSAPHVEVAFRIRAVSEEAVSSGDFTLDVRPAWTAGVLSGRFASLLGRRPSDLYRTLPTMTRGALPAQLSFVPDFPHAQNVSRIPALLPHVIPVGETRTATNGVIDIDDLTVLSTGEQLHLVSTSRRRIVEPHVLHPLALEKQAPALVRFLAQLGRGFATAWTAFDWGPVAAALPCLPRVRHRRTVLAPARWRLSAADLPPGPYGTAWRAALDAWAAAWRCPARLHLLDDDRTMLLDRTEPLHARLIHQHLRRHPHAVLTEAVHDGELGWLGHAHEFTVPLTTTRPQVPHPDLTRAPVVTNRDLAHPGDPGQRWTQAKVFTHPTAMDEILTLRLPRLLDALGTSRAWFVRYRSLQETDHLRIRVPTGGPGSLEATLRALSDWTKRLAEDRLASRLVLDGYRPETGRYGTGAAMEAAEDVFVADSLVARYALTDIPGLERETVCALNMIDLAEGFLGTHEGRAWTARTPAPGKPRPEATRQTVGQVGTGPLLHATPRLAHAVARRRAALGAYRSHTDAGRLEQALESLLHMHHNRLIGPDRDSEAASRHAARQACRSLVMRKTA